MYLLNRFSKCQCFIVFIAITKRQWCLECILKLKGFARTKGFLLCRDLQQLNSSHGVNYERATSKNAVLAFILVK